MAKVSRLTRQKEIIEKEINGLDQLFTAEELFAKVEPQMVGIATVYRFLHDLRKGNKIHAYVCNRKTLYSRHETVHAHFHCQVCRKMSHIDVASIDFIKDNIKGEVCHLQIDVTGTCPICLSKKSPTRHMHR